jgi:hypothetical protein
MRNAGSDRSYINNGRQRIVMAKKTEYSFDFSVVW